MKGRTRRKFFIHVRSVRIIWRVFVNITGECESTFLHTHTKNSGLKNLRRLRINKPLGAFGKVDILRLIDFL